MTEEMRKHYEALVEDVAAIENARIKGELDCFCTLIGKFLGNPISLVGGLTSNSTSLPMALVSARRPPLAPLNRARGIGGEGEEGPIEEKGRATRDGGAREKRGRPPAREREIKETETLRERETHGVGAESSPDTN
jgi:hypothetical protein